MSCLARAPLRAARGPALLPAFHAFAAARRDHVEEIVAAIVISDLVAGMDHLDGAQDDLPFAPVQLGVWPAGMVGITRDVLPARAVDGPAAVDLVEIPAATGLELFGLFIRQPTPLIFRYESTLLDRVGREQAKARP